MPQLFYIRIQGAPQLGLNAQNGGTPFANQAIILWTLEANLPSQNNSVWSLQPAEPVGGNAAPAYYIASATNSDMVMDLSGSQQYSGSPAVVLAQKSTGKASQIWSLQSGGVANEPKYGIFVNNSNGQYLTGYQGVGKGTPLITYPSDPNTAGNYCWEIEPIAVPVQQPTAIISVTSASLAFGASDMANLQGLTVPEDGASIDSPKVDVALGTLSQPDSSIWNFTADGFIVSALNPQLVLSQIGTDVCVLPRQPDGYTSFQQWVVTSELDSFTDGIKTYQYTALRIANFSSGLYLTVNGQAITLGSGIPSDNSQLWFTPNGYPLETILVQPPNPYPTAAAGTPAYECYTYLTTQLTPKCEYADGIRGGYTSADTALLQSWQTQLPTIAPPSDPTEAAAWPSVQSQIGKELDAVIPVQGMYNVLWALHTAMQSSVKDSVQTIEGIIGGSFGNATGSAGTVIEGLVLAAVNLIPDVGGAAASLLQTGIDLATGKGDVELKKFVMAASALQTLIDQTFKAVQTASADQATVVLNDWGKVRAVAQLVAMPWWHPWSLDLTRVSADTLADDVGKGSELAIMQYLLSASYQVWTWYSIPNSYSLSSILPPNAQGVWQEGLQGDVYNAYMLATGDWSQFKNPSYPSNEAMAKLWSLGAQRFNVFRRQAGWDNISLYAVDAGDLLRQNEGGWNQILLVNVRNCTPNTLTVGELVGNHASYISVNTNNLTIGPFGTLSYVNGLPAHNGDISSNVYLYDLNYSNSTYAVQFEPMISGNSCSLNWNTENFGYGLTPQSLQGLRGDQSPDICNVQIVFN